MIHYKKYEYIQVEIASPEQIKSWAERTLPNGEKIGQVTKPYTLHYSSHKPEIDGLFCERIFGPVKSGVCACGRYQGIIKNNTESKFCKLCGVEFTDSKVRRYRMGYIQLACHVTHLWYLKKIPSHIGNLLRIPLKTLEGLVYCDLFLPRPIIKKPILLKIDSIFNYDEQSWQESLPNFFSTKNFEIFKDREMLTGGDAIHQKLTELNLEKIAFESYNDWLTLQKEEFTGNIYEDRKIQRIKDLLVRRIRIAKYFLQSNIKPEWMVISILPVLPPELRPMLELQQGELITSDLNELYRKVIYRNNSLIGFLKRSNSTPLGVILNQKRLVQEAVDALIDNRIGNHIMKDRNHRPYKSFSEMIEGKEGRFRQDLLGKRVDYSGRSVIVVGPSLSLHQCGLPREMAIILFQPFLIRGLIARKLARNFIAAKKMIKNQNPIIWSILEESIKNHPILLNRAPTLHRLGIQAFQPILTKECAIQLHPLVCSGFNADFDGDQMAVHVPLSLEAQTEARLLMLAHGNLISPATGETVAVPSQDMLLGLYILTMQNRKGIYNYINNKIIYKIPYFSNYNHVLQLRDQGKIFINDSLWLKCSKNFNSTTIGEENPLEIQIDSYGMQYKIYENWQIYENQLNIVKSIYLLTTTGRVIFNQQLNESIQVFI